MALLREATTSSALVPLAERSAIDFSFSKFPSAFGNIRIDYGAKVQQLSFAEVEKMEWDAIEQLLQRYLSELAVRYAAENPYANAS